MSHGMEYSHEGWKRTSTIVLSMRESRGERRTQNKERMKWTTYTFEKDVIMESSSECVVVLSVEGSAE